MGYFDGVGDIQRFLQEDTGALRERFRPSRDFLDRMERLYDRRQAPRAHPVSGYLPRKVFSDTDQARMARTLYTSNHVMQMAVSFLNRMERSQVIVNVATTSGSRAEGQRQSILEQFCQGVLGRQTQRTVEERRGSTFIRRMSAFAFRRASVAQRIDVRAEGGKTEIVWDLYDPYHTYFDFGEGPRRFFSDQYLRKDAAAARAHRMGLRLPTAPAWTQRKSEEMVQWTDYWFEESDGEGGEALVQNAILVEGEVLREPRDMRYGRLPISVVCLNNGDLEDGQGARSYGGSFLGGGSLAVPDTYLESLRTPLYASLESTIPQLEDLFSLELLGAAFAVNPPRKLRKVTDQPGSAEFAHELFGPGVTVVMPEGWDLEMMNLQASSLEKFAVKGELLAQIERVWPVVLFGATSGANESGFLFNQRIDQGQNALVNPALGVALALRLGLEEIIYQFRRSGVGEMALRVREDPDSEKYQVKTFRAADLPKEGYELAVTVPPMLPNDDLRQTQIYQLAVQSGMLDEKLALAVIGKVQDPEAVIRRKLQDQVRNSQPAKDEAVIEYFRETAEALAAEARRQTGQARWDLLLAARRYRERASALEQRLGLGFQMTPQPGGITPAEQPPEERGVENPSVQRALAGQPPPGGRPLGEEGGS